MSFPEKIDVLDLIINVLNEHEKKLDMLVERLEVVVDLMIEHPDYSMALEEFEERTKVQYGKSGSILIVDDDEFLTETFKMLFEDSGFYVETASTGNQALLKASQVDFDLAILDLNLPDTTGNELAKCLKARREDLNIVLLTGQTELLENMGDNQLGTDEIMLKPVDPLEMLRIAEKLKTRA